MTTSHRHDAIVIGAGPSGAVAALVMARAGLDVMVLERDTFPRFRIGESFLPGTLKLMRDLRIDHILADITHVPKFGGEFVMGAGSEPSQFDFGIDPQGRPSETFNAERALFDARLIREAADAGATVRFGTQVKHVDKLDEGDVAVTTMAGSVRGRVLLDASGGATVVGRHLGAVQRATDPNLRKVACFAHFEGVHRATGRHAGSPVVVMCDEGWFWLIPLSETKTSVGFVLDSAVAKQIDVPASRLLQWGIARCPQVRERMARATGPDTNQVVADYTYRCDPIAGPGYFLLGDAAEFLDPVFSTGVHLGMLSGRHAGELVAQMHAGSLRADAARKRFSRQVQRESRLFFQFVRDFYKHSFREIFLHGHGPFDMQPAVLQMLAGHASCNPPWPVRWRYAGFRMAVAAQRVVPLVPRRSRWSLLEADVSTHADTAGAQPEVDQPEMREPVVDARTA